MIINNLNINTIEDFNNAIEFFSYSTKYYLTISYCSENNLNISDFYNQYEIENINDQSELMRLSDLYILTNLSENPEFVDFEIYGLDKVKNIIKGELVNIQYLKNNLLAVNEIREYVRDQYGVVIYRHTKIDWYKYGNIIGVSKEWDKYYPPEEAIQEGMDRRTNIVNNVKFYLLEQLGQNYSFDLLLSVKTQIQYYIDGYKQPLIDAINSSNKTYLIANIRLQVIDKITF